MSFTSVFEEQSLREMVRLLATVIVYFDVTKMSQRRHSSDFSFTSGYISECWNSSRSCTTLMRFESDHLKKAVALLRKPVKEVLGTEILEFVKDRGPECTIPGHLEHGFKLKFVPSTYEATLILIGHALQFGDPTTNKEGLRDILHEKLLASAEGLRSKAAASNVPPVVAEEPVALRTRGSASAPLEQPLQGVISRVTSSTQTRQTSNELLHSLISDLPKLDDADLDALVVAAQTERRERGAALQQQERPTAITPSTPAPPPLIAIAAGSSRGGGRPAITLQQRDKEVKKLRLVVKKLYPQTPEEEDLQLDRLEAGLAVAGLVQEAVKSADVLKSKINYQQALSLHTGMLVQSLRSMCNVSLEKMPLVIATVLTMLFGLLPLALFKSLVPASSTLDASANRASHYLGERVTRLFTSDLPVAFICATLILDASNKGEKDLVCKVVVGLCYDLVVRYTLLNTDRTITSKSLGGSHLTTESLYEQLTFAGVWKITSAVVDYFGLGEAKQVLVKLDEAARDNPDKDRMTLKSKFIPDQFYMLGAAFRIFRWLTCKMHALDRIFKPWHNEIIGKQGLGKNGTTAQNVYSIAYYMRIYKDYFQFLARTSVGGDITTPLPEELDSLLKTICSSRWLSSELTNFQLWQLLNVPATDDLITYIREVCAFDDDVEWANIVDFATTPDDASKPSHLILCFLFIANTGTGDSAKKCGELVSFLCSPYHRVNIRLCACMYQLHRKWASFIDGRSGTHPDVETHSTRLLEAPGFERNMYASLASLEGEGWKTHSEFIAAYDTMQKEAQRAVKFQAAGDAAVVTLRSFEEAVDLKVQRAVEAMMPKAQKYLCNQMNRIAFVPVFLTDPILAPHVAEAMLDAFAENGDIDLDAFRLAKTKFKQLPAIGSQVAHAPFTVECPVNAWPGKTYRQLRVDIKNMWLKVGGTHTKEQVTALMEAYGLLHPSVLDELFVLATDHLRKELVAKNKVWVPGVGLTHYWKDFTLLSPAITDIFDVHFAGVVIASTIIEQVFTMAGPAAHANMATRTTSNSISFRVNVGSAFCRGKERGRLVEQLKVDARARQHRGDDAAHPAGAEGAPEGEYDSEDEAEVGVAKAKRYRELRCQDGLYDYLHFLEDLTTEVEDLKKENGDKVTRRSINGKRKDEQLRMAPHVRREIAANTRKGSKRVMSGTIKATTERYNCAWITGDEALPPIVMEPFLAAAKSKVWKVAGKRAYLIQHYRVEGELVEEEKDIKKARLEPKDEDPEGYVTLISMLLVCWELNGTDEEELAGIIEDFKDVS
jgi:hypothetical protein